MASNLLDTCHDQQRDDDLCVFDSAGPAFRYLVGFGRSADFAIGRGANSVWYRAGPRGFRQICAQFSRRDLFA